MPTEVSAAAAFRAAAHDEWDAAVGHRFVDELLAGTIDDQVLAGYLVQDYQFFEAFVELLGQCVASADTVDAKLTFSRQLGILAADENKYFVDSFDALGVSEKQIASPELKPATLGFRELMRRTLQTRSYPQILTLLVVAEWLYLDWAQRATVRNHPLPPRPEHRGWIELHTGAAFRSWVGWLISELDRVAAPDDAALAALFAEATSLELQFFDDAYR